MNTPSLAAALAAGPVILDGGLATQLEARGHDLSDSLWSARLLLDDPAEVRAAHADFFAAGAQVATTASYQVSESGFREAGLSAEQAVRALGRSVSLAREAADSFDDDRPRWVAASVGPYGATLADGSEYRGDYGLDVAALRRWHRPRLDVLAAAGADVLAVETLPCLAEVEALIAELADLGVPFWLSVTVAAGATRAREPLSEAFAMAAGLPGLVAVGANCCDPAELPAVAQAAAHHDLPVVFYPNSGETWDAAARQWTGAPTVAGSGPDWVGRGARLIGGCCRVTPAQIHDLAAAVNSSP